MALFKNTSLERLRAGQVSIGFGAGLLRSVATPLLAKTAGYDWLFIDMEHGAFSINEATQLCIAALPTGVTPIVRVCADALDEGTRALDNGALGIIVPHVDTPAQAKRVGEAFRFPPQGTRSWGGGLAVLGFEIGDLKVAQAEVNAGVLICGMIETAEAVANVDAIAATPGIDVLLIGTSDLTADLGISGQAGHAKVQDAYRKVIDACTKHGKFAGMGGIYDEEWARFYVKMGARFLLGGSDQSFMLGAAIARAKFLHAL